MPYIICVNQPGCLPESDPVAVATIEETRDVALNHAAGEYTEPDMRHSWANRARELPEAGGIIGPLPDGYVIDVRRVTAAELAAFAQLDYDSAKTWPEPRIIDAYNNA